MGDVGCGGVTQHGNVMTRAVWHAMVTWQPLKCCARFTRRDDVAADMPDDVAAGGSIVVTMISRRGGE